MPAEHSSEESNHLPNRCHPHSQLGNDSIPDNHVRRPWFKRPTLAWILCMKTLSSLALSVTLGPRVEIFTELVCREYHPRLAEMPGVLSQPIDANIVGGVASTHWACQAPTEVYLPPDDPATLIDHNPPLREVSTHSHTGSGSCVNDPRTQAEVARLAATFAIIGGALSCLTTGWWGGLLDRYGRTRVMGLIVVGPIMTDLLTIFVFRFSNMLPGKHWFVVITPVLEGIMGAPSSTMAAETSYMRDVSGPQHFARNFSLLLGVFYAGGAIGPVLGGFLNEQTGSVISALYCAIAFHLAYGIAALVALPESIARDAMVDARHRYTEELERMGNVDTSPLRRQVLMAIKSFWDSFPLNVLAPKPSPNPQQKRDWNLTWLATSACLINVILGSYSSVYQYALYTFGWSSLELGYFISASGMSTVIFLAVILPAILSVSKSARGATQAAEDIMRNTRFDLYLVRASSLIFAPSYALMGIAPTGIIFTLCFILSTFGQGFLPAIQSVAAIHHASLSGKNDTGRLFGALGVVYVLGGRIIGPALSGAVYAVTVSSLPSAIFWLSAGCSLTAFLFLSFVRLPGLTPNVHHTVARVYPELEPLLGHE